LCFPIEIIDHPTVRDATGLALSSRNVHLSTDDRTAATVLNKALDLAQAAVLAQISADKLYDMIRTRISAEPRAVIRTIDIVSPDDLSPVTGQVSDEIAILLAVEFGDVLLIDQRVMHPMPTRRDTPTGS
jgi:pantoate--beta-alanine ligase